MSGRSIANELDGWPDDLILERQRMIYGSIADDLPEGFGLHRGGSGNRDFRSNVDFSEGYWEEKKGHLRWIFHIVPDKSKGWELRLPPYKEAWDFPGGVNTTAESKGVLSFIAVTLVKREEGDFYWPLGWQFLVILSLEKPLPTMNTSVKIHSLDIERKTLMADTTPLSVHSCGVVGVRPPETSLYPKNYTKPIRYEDVGRRLAALIESHRQGR